MVLGGSFLDHFSTAIKRLFDCLRVRLNMCDKCHIYIVYFSLYFRSVKIGLVYRYI